MLSEVWNLKSIFKYAYWCVEFQIEVRKFPCHYFYACNILSISTGLLRLTILLCTTQSKCSLNFESEVRIRYASVKVKRILEYVLESEMMHSSSLLPCFRCHFFFYESKLNLGLLFGPGDRNETSINLVYI